MAKSVTRSAGLLLVLLFGVLARVHSQTGFGGPWGRQPRIEVFADFDRNKDGRLDDREMLNARNHVRQLRGAEPLEESLNYYLPLTTGLLFDIQKSAASAPKDGTDLYDEKIFRTLYLRFRRPDWFGEVSDFVNTDVEVSADLIVDGEVYSGVGVHFRGSSSLFMIGDSPKKSFNISIDHENGSQRLYGYRTLNLLNNNADPSFMREVLFSRISRSYTPALKANFVKLVINGENWGVYTNVEQFNNDFLREWFGTAEGARWKVPPGRGGAGGLAYSGPDPAGYERYFELQSKADPGAWLNLVNLCDVLTNAPDSELEEKLDPLLDIDGALWLLALENVFIDGDGYISRGSDYSLYQNPQGRFHLVSRDNNETFGYAGGGGPNKWPDDDPMLAPLGHIGNPGLPVISRLLSIPHLQARYLAHMRTIVEEWLDWNVLKPVIRGYRSLIEEEVKKDDKKLYSYDAFLESFSERAGGSGYGNYHRAPGLEAFVNERRSFLLARPELNTPAPVIESVEAVPDQAAGSGVYVTAKIGQAVKPSGVFMWYGAGIAPAFRSLAMFDDGGHNDGMPGDGTYGCAIPAFPEGTSVRYYVEARSAGSPGSAAFSPKRTGREVLSYRTGFGDRAESPVVINEFMARNTVSVPDPQGEYDDWIELCNTGPGTADLSGMYLSDKAGNPRKWKFPEGVTIPSGGYLLLWADEDGGDKPGLHLNFRLSGGGERIMLVDTDERGNRILDTVEFGRQKKDAACGRLPDGTGGFETLAMTPGRRNEKW